MGHSAERQPAGHFFSNWVLFSEQLSGNDRSYLGKSHTKIAVTFFLENHIHGNFLCVTTNVPIINPVEIITGKLRGKKSTELEKKCYRMAVRRHILVDLMIFSEL